MNLLRVNSCCAMLKWLGITIHAKVDFIYRITEKDYPNIALYYTIAIHIALKTLHSMCFYFSLTLTNNYTCANSCFTVLKLLYFMKGIVLLEC